MEIDVLKPLQQLGVSVITLLVLQIVHAIYAFHTSPHTFSERIMRRVNDKSWTKNVDYMSEVKSLLEQVGLIFQNPDRRKMLEDYLLPGFLPSKIRDYIKETIVNSRRKIRPCKLVIFVDDLDRCPPNKVEDFLQALVTLTDHTSFILFLQIEPQIIATAIECFHGDLYKRAGKNGFHYLEEMVQLPFSILPMVNYEKLIFFKKHVVEKKHEIKESTELLNFHPFKLGIEYLGNIITSVNPTGQAATMGVEVGWKILEINGHLQPDDDKLIGFFVENYKDIGNDISILFDKNPEQGDMYCIVSHNWRQGLSVKRMPKGEDPLQFWWTKAGRGTSVMFRSRSQQKGWEVCRGQGIRGRQKIIHDKDRILPHLEAKSDPFKVGDKVMAQFKTWGYNVQRYPGIIDAINEDGTCSIVFDDGTNRTNCAQNEMNHQRTFTAFKRGDHVIAQLHDSKNIERFDGIIEDIDKNGTCSILFDDGEGILGDVEEEKKTQTIFGPFTIGRKIMVQRKDGYNAQMCPGIVKGINEDGIYSIVFDDSEGYMIFPPQGTKDQLEVTNDATELLNLLVECNMTEYQAILKQAGYETIQDIIENGPDVVIRDINSRAEVEMSAPQAQKLIEWINQNSSRTVFHLDNL